MKRLTLFKLGIVLAFFLSLIIPFIVILSSSHSLSSFALFHQDIAGDILRERAPTATPWIYHYTLSFFPLHQLAQGLVFFSLLIVLLYFLFHPTAEQGALGLLIIALSPAIIGSVLFNAEILFSLLLLLGSLYCLSKGDSNRARLLGYLLFTLYSSQSVVHAFIGIFIIMLFLGTQRSYSELAPTFLFLLLISSGVSILFSRPLYSIFDYEPLSLLALFTELGAQGGISIFLMLLAFFSIYSYWKKRRISIPSLITTILLIGLFPFLGQFSMAVLTLLFIPLAVLSFHKLVKKRWHSSFFKFITLLSLLCGLLFAQMAYIDRAYTLLPDDASFEAMRFARDQLPADALVLSHRSQGLLIDAVADKTPYISTIRASQQDTLFEESVVDILFTNRDFDETIRLLKRAEITHIFITPEMKDGQVWHRDNEGLLFILRDATTFTKVYSRDGYDLWRFNDATD